MSDDYEARPEVRTMLATVGELERFAGDFKVSTAEQFTAGAEDLKRVKAAQKSLEETRTSLTGPLNETLRRINALFKAPGERLARVEGIIKGKLQEFQREQERRRQEAQRKLDEEAARERRRVEAAAAEARRKAEAEAAELRRKADDEAAAGRAAEAQKLAAKADAKIERAETRAEELEQRAATTVAPTIQIQAPKVAGLSSRENWVFTIVDASKLPPQFLMPDEKKIGQLVRSMKGDAAAILGEGVKVENKPILASARA